MIVLVLFFLLLFIFIYYANSSAGKLSFFASIHRNKCGRKVVDPVVVKGIQRHRGGGALQMFDHALDYLGAVVDQL